MRMIPKQYWKIYKVRSGSTSRKCTYKRGASTNYTSLRYNSFSKNIYIQSSVAGWHNICYPYKVDTKGIYNSKVDDIVRCYKFHLDGEDFYVPVQAFYGNSHVSNLNQVVALPEDEVDFEPYIEYSDIDKDITTIIYDFANILDDKCKSILIHNNMEEIIIKDRFSDAIIIVLAPSIKDKSCIMKYLNIQDDSYISTNIYTIEDLLKHLEYFLDGIKTIYPRVYKQLNNIMNDLYVEL